METFSVRDGVIEAAADGHGEPVLLIHGSIIADAFLPLTRESVLTDRYQLITYHRRGFAGSTRPVGSFSIVEQAADAAAVLEHFNLGRAHIAGQSYGGVIALQLALDTPNVVSSLALLEPALMGVPSASEFFEAVEPVQAAYASGDKAEAIEGFAQLVGGPDYRATLERTLPAGWFEQAVDDAETFFRIEVPALQEWAFTPELASRLTMPVLAVLGAESAPLFVEGHRLLKQWLPQSEPFVLPGATHLLQMADPGRMAAGLASFFVRHPISVAA